MDHHMLLQHHMQQPNQQAMLQQHHRGQLIADEPNVAGQNPFDLLIQRDIPECRLSLRENHVNLQRLGDYCKVNYLQKPDRDLALDETKQFAQQALASVAYQLNAYAFNLTQLFDYQFNQITDTESDVRYLSHLVTMHREKVARREIGVLTTNKVTKRDTKIVPPAQPERVQRYHRQRIDYGVFDDIGHGVRPAGSMTLGKQASVGPSSGGGYATGSVALRGQLPQHRDSISSSSNPSPLPWMPMMPFDDNVVSARQRGTGTLGRHAAGQMRGLGGEYVGVVQVPQLQQQQDPRYPNATGVDNNYGNFPASAVTASYQRSASNAGDMQQQHLRSSTMTDDYQSNSSAFPHLQQQLPTGRVDYSDATLLPPHRRAAAAASATNNHKHINTDNMTGLVPSANPYLTTLADHHAHQYNLAQQQQHQQIMPPPPLISGDPNGIVQSHYATQRQVFSHMPPAAFGTLHHHHQHNASSRNNNQQQQQVAANGGSHYASNNGVSSAQYQQSYQQHSQDTLANSDVYSNGTNSATLYSNSVGSAGVYSTGNASTVSVPPSSMQMNNSKNEDYNILPNNNNGNKHAMFENMNQKFSQMPMSGNAEQSRSNMPTMQHQQPYQSTSTTIEPPSNNVPSTAVGGVPRLYLEKVVAIYDYARMQPDELEFKEGQVIYVLRKNEDGWYEGVLDGIRGLFPGNYVETLEGGPMTSASHSVDIDMHNKFNGNNNNNGFIAGGGYAVGQPIYR